MTEDFSKLVSGTKMQIQKFQRTPSMINAPKTTPWHVSFKPQKIKVKNKEGKNKS